MYSVCIYYLHRLEAKSNVCTVHNEEVEQKIESTIIFFIEFARSFVQLTIYICLYFIFRSYQTTELNRMTILTPSSSMCTVCMCVCIRINTFHSGKKSPSFICSPLKRCKKMSLFSLTEPGCWFVLSYMFILLYYMPSPEKKKRK